MKVFLNQIGNWEILGVHLGTGKICEAGQIIELKGMRFWEEKYI